LLNNSSDLSKNGCHVLGFFLNVAINSMNYLFVSVDNNHETLCPTASDLPHVRPPDDFTELRDTGKGGHFDKVSTSSTCQISASLAEKAARRRIRTSLACSLAPILLRYCGVGVTLRSPESLGKLPAWPVLMLSQGPVDAMLGVVELEDSLFEKTPLPLW
jgi:hypothetical protein